MVPYLSVLIQQIKPNIYLVQHRYVRLSQLCLVLFNYRNSPDEHDMQLSRRQALSSFLSMAWLLYSWVYIHLPIELSLPVSVLIPTHDTYNSRQQPP